MIFGLAYLDPHWDRGLRGRKHFYSTHCKLFVCGAKEKRKKRRKKKIYWIVLKYFRNMWWMFKNIFFICLSSNEVLCTLNWNSQLFLQSKAFHRRRSWKVVGRKWNQNIGAAQYSCFIEYARESVPRSKNLSFFCDSLETVNSFPFSLFQN